MSDRFARVLTALAVLGVATVAAVVSFSHIESLALAHGQPLMAARLLPLSVDGLIVVSSLTLLTEARARRSAPGMARAGLVLGVVATVLANLAYGARYGAVGAVISAWPTLAFIVSTEILLTQMRRAGTTLAGERETEAVADVPADVNVSVPVPAPVIDPVDVPASTVTMPRADTARTVTPGRAPQRARGRKPKAPEKVFADELDRGELPSIRAIKSRARCGTPRAQEIRDSLAAVLREAQPEAA